MLENNREFLIIMEEQSYLIKSFESTFEKEHVKAKVTNIATVSTILAKEQPQGYLICTSAELLNKMVGIKVIVDHAIEHKTPVFVMGNVEELEKLWELIPKQMFTDIFIRPINVVEMVEDICKQVDAYYRMKKRTILAVDDSGVMLRNIKTLLEDKYQVIPVNSSERAIKYLALSIPDLILLDYEMPIVDGKQFMQMIREDAEFQNIPIIFLTGKNDAQTVMDVMSLKPDGYLLKNMDAQKLHEAIDEFFVNRQNK